MKIEPQEGPANGISTCVKGKFGWDFVNSPDRLTQPLIREGGQFREASWDEALDLGRPAVCRNQGSRAGRIRSAFISSSKCTNEESYLMQKLARARGRHEQHRQLLALLPGAGHGRACSARSATAATLGRSPTLRRPTWC